MSRLQRRLQLSCLLAGCMVQGLVAVAQPSTPESASTPPPSEAVTVTVSEDRCSGLDTQEVERLLQIELAIVAARAERPRSPSVSLSCSAQEVNIVVTDSETGIELTRTLPAPAPGEAGRERLLALGASQLFLGSWLAVVVDGKDNEASEPRPPPPTPEPKPEPRPEAGPAVERPRSQVSVQGGAGLRDWAAPLPSMRAALWGELPLGPMLVGLQASWERARSERVLGRIVVQSTDLALTSSTRVAHAGSWELEAGARLGGGWVSAQGRADEGSLGRRASGASGHVAAFLRGGVAWQRWFVTLTPELAWTWPKLRAQSDSDAALVWHGAWAGLSIGVGYRAAEAP